MATAASFAAAVSSLRELSTPYHLAHGLLDHAGYLTRLGDAGAAAAAIAEARAIGQRLRCQPLLDRADASERATRLPASPVHGRAGTFRSYDITIPPRPATTQGKTNGRRWQEALHDGYIRLLTAVLLAGQDRQLCIHRGHPAHVLGRS